MVKQLGRALWEDLVGKPFEVRARGPRAYDCYGLLVEVFRRQGVIVPDVGYSGDDDDQTRALLQASDDVNEHRIPWERIAEPEAGAVGLFRKGQAPAHVGVFIDDDLFIHATEDHGQVVLSRLSRGYARFLLGAYAHVA